MTTLKTRASYTPDQPKQVVHFTAKHANIDVGHLVLYASSTELGILEKDAKETREPLTHRDGLEGLIGFVNGRH